MANYSYFNFDCMCNSYGHFECHLIIKADRTEFLARAHTHFSLGLVFCHLALIHFTSHVHLQLLATWNYDNRNVRCFIRMEKKMFQKPTPNNLKRIFSASFIVSYLSQNNCHRFPITISFIANNVKPNVILIIIVWMRLKCTWE